MQLSVAYHRRSAITEGPGGVAVALAPNLRRDRVSFSGTLRDPLRFREAVSALHDVVIADLKYKAKDRSAHDEYLKRMKQREEAIRRAAADAARDDVAPEFPAERRRQVLSDAKRLNRVYWDARQKYSDFLQQHDPELFRLLVPMDPVITVAPDVLFFECFSADESSYGCLTVGRDAFSSESDVSLGTTNIDYSWALYDHFQELRSYRQTRFAIDPGGFEVRTPEARPGYREEKIDLPASWLRGFMQLQSAMSLPLKRVPLSREAVYSILAYLKRHKATRSPRAVRFELTPGQPTQIILEPFEQKITAHGCPYTGTKAETIRSWGRDRLRVLARLLPIVESAEVFLLGTGLPSFWVVHMGDLRLILGLSGWTANDWTAASALDQVMPPAEPSPALLGDIAAVFRANPTQTFAEIRARTGAAPAFVAAGLNKLALLGQVIHDMPAGKYRWRQVMPVALSQEQVGPDNPETIAARQIVAANQVYITRDEKTPTGLRAVGGTVPERPAEVYLDGDGKIVKGKCNCSHFYTGGLRRGPCRHLQALRTAAVRGTGRPSLEAWFEGLTNVG